jgi:multidrug transporter EmrE-like cation transporter
VATIVLILSGVSLSAIAQVVLKLGASGPRVQSLLADKASPTYLLAAMAGNAYLWLGLMLYGLSALIWLLVLARVDVSFAYPFVGIGFILTMLFGAIFLSEAVGPIRILGTLLVVFGVMLVSRT